MNSITFKCIFFNLKIEKELTIFKFKNFVDLCWKKESLTINDKNYLLSCVQNTNINFIVLIGWLLFNGIKFNLTKVHYLAKKIHFIKYI